MRKFVIFLLSFSLMSLIVALSANSVFAESNQVPSGTWSNSAIAISAREVLGDSTAQVPLSIPPTAEGPGLLLPDSPLFFLDRMKQEFRLLLAFTPEQKAKIHNAVAGERLAELQLMLAKNKISGIRIALQGVSDNLKNASDDLINAGLTGRNISLQAKSINDSIKEKQQKLSILENRATGEIRAQVQAAKEALKIAKIKVEDNLPDDLLRQEIEDDLDQEIEDRIRDATNSAKGINRAIDVLTRLASEAAQKGQERRQEALIKAIEVKDEAFRKQQEKLISAENKTQEKLTEAKKKALEKAKDSAGKIDEAINKFQEAKSKISEIKSSEED